MVSKNSILPTYRFFVLIFLLYPWFGSIRFIQPKVTLLFSSPWLSLCSLMSSWLSQLLFQLRFHLLALRFAVHIITAIPIVHNFFCLLRLSLSLRLALLAWLPWCLLRCFCGFRAAYALPFLPPCLPAPAPAPACAAMAFGCIWLGCVCLHILRATFLLACSTCLWLSRSLWVSTRTASLVTKCRLCLG